MSNGQEDVSSQPLVIVRRRRNTDEGHHGGAWKIAYADFMTAMMAFFLVMWLVNAADKKTIVQVAAYFNPVRLTDRKEEPKGIEDFTEDVSKATEKKGKKGFEKKDPDSKTKKEADQPSQENSGDAADDAGAQSSSGSGGKSKKDQQEAALFDDPGNLLDKLADDAKGSQVATNASPSDGNISDPFDRTNRRAGKSQANLKPAQQAVPPAPVQPSIAMRAAPDAAVKAVPQDAKQPSAARSFAGEAEDKLKQQNKISKVTPATLDQSKTEDKLHDKERDKDHDKDEEAKYLQQQISSAVAAVSRDLPQIEVKATAEGVLVSLTDDANFGMFEVGSAKPRAELVLIMEKIGHVLSKTGGNIIVRGHTDARPYKSRLYDNWRLSAARAQMAYYMLLRGGIEDARVVAIEGRADRDPKVPSDTLAATNRRIDILVKEEKK
jgi:chemotaxis protein MotB